MFFLFLLFVVVLFFSIDHFVDFFLHIIRKLVSFTTLIDIKKGLHIYIPSHLHRFVCAANAQAQKIKMIFIHCYIDVIIFIFIFIRSLVPSVEIHEIIESERILYFEMFKNENKNENMSLFWG